MTTCSRFSTLQVSWIYPNRVWGSSCTIVLDHCIGHQLSVQPCPVKLDLHSVLPSDQLCNLVADLRNLAEYSLMDLLPWRMHCSLTRAFSSSKGSSNCSWKACMNLHMLHSSGVQVRYTVTYHLATAPPPSPQSQEVHTTGFIREGGIPFPYEFHSLYQGNPQLLRAGAYPGFFPGRDGKSWWVSRGGDCIKTIKLSFYRRGLGHSRSCLNLKSLP